MKNPRGLPKIPGAAIEWRAIRSPGPGGQNVNKVATAVQLRIYMDRTALAPSVRERLARLAGRRATGAGELLIEASRFRSQERNRVDAWARFEALLTQALVNPKVRVPTRASQGERKRRLEHKRVRGATKRLRRAASSED